MEVMINERKMEIKKGKYYYNKETDKLFLADKDMIGEDCITDKIAVHTPTKDDWDYVCGKLGYRIENWSGGHWGTHTEDSCVEINEQMYGSRGWHTTEDYHIITMQQFKALFESREQGKKESEGKLPYELDWLFVEQMAERMHSNKHKYEPYNWKKPIDIDKLKESLTRHFISVQKGIYEDDGRTFGHLEAISCISMMINYQLKHNINA